MSEDASVESTDGGLTYGEWRDALESGTLVGLECRECEAITATPKAACIQCASRDLRRIDLPVRGELHTETSIAVTPAGRSGPYRVGIVDLGRTSILGRVDGEVAIGDEIVLAGHVAEEELPAPVFEPVE